MFNPIPSLRVAAPIFAAAIAGILAACGDDGTSVDLESDTGELAVGAVTTGDDLDRFGYRLVLVREGFQRERTIAANGSVMFEDVPAGSYTLDIGEVDGNCTVADGTERSVSIRRSETTSLALRVECLQIRADLTVRISTTGNDPDVTGFQLQANSNPPIDVAPNDEITLPVVGRQHTLRLLGVAPNCAVSPLRAIIDAGKHDGSPIPLDVICAEEELIAFGRRTPGSDFDIHVVDVNSGATRRVVGLPGDQGGAEWAPDGETLALVEGGDVFVVHSDGSNLRRLTDGLGAVGASWLPDGSGLLFSRIVEDGIVDVFRVSLDERAVARLTDRTGFDLLAATSPDGSRIAFWSDRSGAFEVHAMNSDGGGVVQLTDGALAGGGVPLDGIEWSPDGTKILYTAGTQETLSDIRLMNADGSGDRLLVGTEAGEFAPTWSPDGSRVLFTRDADIWQVGVDGTDMRILIGGPADETNPDWRR